MLDSYDIVDPSPMNTSTVLGIINYYRNVTDQMIFGLDDLACGYGEAGSTRDVQMADNLWDVINKMEQAWFDMTTIANWIDNEVPNV